MGFQVAGAINFGEFGKQLVEHGEVAEHIDEGELLHCLCSRRRQDELDCQVDVDGHDRS